MSHRTPLRIFLLTLGVLAVGVVGAALLDPGTADAAGPTPLLTVGDDSVAVGPLTVDSPVPLPVAQPIQVAAPVPPVVSATLAPLPLAGPIVQTPIHVGLPTIAELPTLPGLGRLPVPGLPTDLPIIGSVTRAPGVVITARSSSALLDASLRPILDATTPGAPIAPSIPWTLTFTGLLAAFATAGADGPGAKRTGDSPLLAVLTVGRNAVARLLARLGPSRPDATRPGLALLLARPG